MTIILAFQSIFGRIRGGTSDHFQRWDAYEKRRISWVILELSP